MTIRFGKWDVAMIIASIPFWWAISPLSDARRAVAFVGLVLVGGFAASSER